MRHRRDAKLQRTLRLEDLREDRSDRNLFHHARRPVEFDRAVANKRRVVFFRKGWTIRRLNLDILPRFLAERHFVEAQDDADAIFEEAYRDRIRLREGVAQLRVFDFHVLQLRFVQTIRDEIERFARRHLSPSKVELTEEGVDRRFMNFHVRERSLKRRRFRRLATERVVRSKAHRREKPIFRRARTLRLEGESQVRHILEEAVAKLRVERVETFVRFLLESRARLFHDLRFRLRFDRRLLRLILASRQTARQVADKGNEVYPRFNRVEAIRRRRRHHREGVRNPRVAPFERLATPIIRVAFVMQLRAEDRAARIRVNATRDIQIHEQPFRIRAQLDRHLGVDAALTHDRVVQDRLLNDGELGIPNGQKAVDERFGDVRFDVRVVVDHVDGATVETTYFRLRRRHSQRELLERTTRLTSRDVFVMLERKE